jgi:hypothetical protein
MMELDRCTPSLGLVGIFLGNELCFALATESYGMVYGLVRVGLIPLCSIPVIAGSVIRWWRARRIVEDQREQAFWRLSGAVIGIALWAFQWLSSATLFIE